MKTIQKAAFLFGVTVFATFAATPIATITSAEPFELDGHSVNTPGVSSFPVVVGDTVATNRGAAVLVFSDGSAMKLGSNSSVRIAGVEAKPKVVLLAGALDYKIVPGSKLSVTNLDSERKLGSAPLAPPPSPFLQLRPGLIARQAPANPPIDAASAAANQTVYANYTGEDTVTAGNWKGKYGADGQVIPSDTTNPPTYATVALMGNAIATLRADPSDPRGLQSSTGATPRNASTFANNFTIDLNLTDGAVHRVSLYLADFENAGRAETVTIVDPSTQKVLSTQTFSSFSSGVYETWAVKGHVQMRVISTGKANAIVNGIFFDGVVAAPAGANSGAEAAPNATNPFFTDPRFLVPLAGAAAAGLAVGLLSLPAASANQ